MATENRTRFTVITNPNYEEQENLSGYITEPNKHEINTHTEANGQGTSGQREKETSEKLSYHTNPMYEKLLQFQQEQKRKRFTVDDLLKW